MFGAIGPTRYDLAFRVGPIPVRVHPAFWLVGVLFASDLFDKGRFDLLAIWILCLFVSILVHELGHAFAALAFGWPPLVFLYHFGGVAIYHPDRGHSTGRSILISLAGPFAGFCLFGLVLVVSITMNALNVPEGEFGRFAIKQLIWINLVWGLVNLLPVLPLDGGRVAEAICTRISPYGGRIAAARISVVVGGCIAAFFFWQREIFGLYPAILFGILCAQNIQMLQAPREREW